MESTEHSGRRQTATERRRRELLEAAERIVLRDGPDASMNAIAAEAGITKPILYRHFGDKGGLYRALAVRHTDALLANLATALDAPVLRRDRVEATLDAYLLAIEARPQVYRFLMHPSDEDNASESGFDVGRHSAPLLQPARRGAGQGDHRPARPGAGRRADRARLGPWHRRHDAWRR